MNRIENNNESLTPFIGRPILLIRKFYVGNDHDLLPVAVDLGIVEHPRKDSCLWVMGPSLMLKADIHGERVHNIMGIDYIPRKPYTQTPMPLPNAEVYSFNSDAEGLEVIEKIKRLEDIKPIK